MKQEDLLKYVNNFNLHKWWSLLIGLGTGVIFFTTVNPLIKEAVSDSFYRFSVYIILLLLWVFYWEHHRSCSRKTKKGMVGFVISIHTENIHEEQLLKADFISRLSDLITAEGLSNLIDVNVLKNHISEKTKNPEIIRKINKKIRGHFYLYGKVKRRFNPENTYFLELNGMVFHIPIDRHNQELLKHDIDTVLPKRVQFLETFEFQGFQFMADTIYLAAKYITGIAAYLSRDAVLAQKLHSNLEMELNKLGKLLPNLEEIKRRIPFLLSSELLSMAQAKANNLDYVGAKEKLREAFSKDPSNYPAMLLQSQIDFLADNDPRKALARSENTIKLRGGDSTVFYNMAFLCFWLGEYSRALGFCDRIVRESGSRDMDVVREVEEFNINLKERGLLKVQLYFWLGFLNYKKKSNLPEAFKYLEEFTKKSTPEMDVLVQRANSYLAEIQREIGI